MIIRELQKWLHNDTCGWFRRTCKIKTVQGKDNYKVTLHEYPNLSYIGYASNIDDAIVRALVKAKASDI